MSELNYAYKRWTWSTARLLCCCVCTAVRWQISWQKYAGSGTPRWCAKTPTICHTFSPKYSFIHFPLSTASSSELVETLSVCSFNFSSDYKRKCVLNETILHSMWIILILLIQLLLTVYSVSSFKTTKYFKATGCKNNQFRLLCFFLLFCTESNIFVAVDDNEDGDDCSFDMQESKSAGECGRNQARLRSERQRESAVCRASRHRPSTVDWTSASRSISLFSWLLRPPILLTVPRRSIEPPYLCTPVANGNRSGRTTPSPIGVINSLKFTFYYCCTVTVAKLCYCDTYLVVLPMAAAT